jgi:hypothetical protein
LPRTGSIPLLRPARPEADSPASWPSPRATCLPATGSGWAAK